MLAAVAIAHADPPTQEGTRAWWEDYGLEHAVRCARLAHYHAWKADRRLRPTDADLAVKIR
jgi:hypothetical protein